MSSSSSSSSFLVAYSLFIGGKVSGQKTLLKLASGSTVHSIPEAVLNQRAAVLSHCGVWDLVVLEANPSPQLLNAIQQGEPMERIEVG